MYIVKKNKKKYSKIDTIITSQSKVKMRKETLDFINVNVRFITDRRQSEKVFYNEKTLKCSCKKP